MGLSTKQVSGDHPELDWSQTLLQSSPLELPKAPPTRRQHQLPPPEPLKCPRCDSTNTKFCYYNNYNKSQPRHFCKACKRHWTKGGTLRNVPVGGGRKNKRHKTSHNTTTTTTITTTTTSTIPTNKTSAAPMSNLSLGFGDQNNLSDSLYQSFIHQPSFLHDNTINSGNFMLSLPQSESLQFPFSSLSSCDKIPSTITCPFQFHSLSGNFKFNEKLENMEDSVITSIMPNVGNIDISQPWEAPTTSSVMELPNYWNWNDIGTVGSADLNIAWDDETEIKP